MYARRLAEKVSTLRSLSRRGAIGAGLALAASRAMGAGAAGGPPLGPPAPFSFDALRQAAAASARRSYAPAPANPDVSALDYDAVGKIAFRPDASLWADLAGDGSVRFFPLGRFAPRAVAIHLVEAGQAREIRFSPSLFQTADPAVAAALARAPGFSGFRVMNAARTSDWLAFQGAAYFRSADPFNQYGLSARGLAIDTATAWPESFPDFTDFWLERGPTGDLVVYAALEGREVAGAFRIANTRGPDGLVQEIDCALFFRAPVQRLGIAPLTSMFWYGENDPPATHDWRPEIHDSDGLAIWTGAGERLWRPLNDPPRVAVNSFVDASPKGYGLLQRDRAFDHYQDDGAFYDRRPSAWVEPLGDWGLGAVELVEIPTAGETDDNIVAFWRPRAAVKAGDALNFRYRLHWTDQGPAPGVARVVATRLGVGGRPGSPPTPGVTKIVVDFDGPGLVGLTRDSGVEALVSVNRGQLESAVAYPVVGTSLWRLMADVRVQDPDSADIRAYLQRGGAALTETWTYQLFNR